MLHHLQPNRRLDTIISALAALFCTFLFPLGVPLASSIVIANDVLSLAVFLALFLLFRAALPLLQGGLFCVTALCPAFLFAVCTIFGVQLRLHNGVDLKKWTIYPAIMAFTLLFFAAILLLWNGLDRFRASDRLAKPRKLLLWTKLLRCKQKWLLLWLGLFLCWAFLLFALYPGFFNYDAWTQLSQAGYLDITTHHPPLHTAFVAMIGVLGLLTQNWNFACAAHLLVQMALVLGVFTFSIYKLRRWGASQVTCFLAAGFYLVFPVPVLFSMSVTKDVLYSAACLLFLILFVDMLRIGKVFFKSPFCILRLFAAGFLLLALRNNALYAFLPFAALAVLFAKGFRWKLSALLSGVVLAFLLYSGPLFALVGIAPGSKAEAYSVPVQQLAAVWNKAPQTYDSEQLSQLYRFIDPGALPKYKPRCADVVKAAFHAPNSKETYVAFWGLWLRIGCRTPGVYINAFLQNTVSAWYPNSIIDGYQGQKKYAEAETSYFEYVNDYHKMTFAPKIPIINAYFHNISTKQTVNNTPLVSLLFSIGFQLWLLVLTFCYAWRRKDLTRLLPIALALLLCATMFLGPMVLVRYYLLLFFAFPFTIASFFYKKEPVYSKKTE
jgi:hypothetical protein